MNILNYINWYALIFSFIIGLVFMYFYSGEPVKIYIYPTNQNYKNMQIMDKTGTCFSVETKETNCDENIGKIKEIPMQ